MYALFHGFENTSCMQHGFPLAMSMARGRSLLMAGQLVCLISLRGSWSIRWTSHPRIDDTTSYIHHRQYAFSSPRRSICWRGSRSSCSGMLASHIQGSPSSFSKRLCRAVLLIQVSSRSGDHHSHYQLYHCYTDSLYDNYAVCHQEFCIQQVLMCFRSTTLVSVITVLSTDFTTTTITNPTTITSTITQTAVATSTVQPAFVATVTTTVVTDASGNVYKRAAEPTIFIESKLWHCLACEECSHRIDRAVVAANQNHGYASNTRAQKASAAYSSFAQALPSIIKTACSCIETPKTLTVCFAVCVPSF